ncbi:MAG: ABC transporter ATP-binding protein, partial [Acidimicrobiales bacterium]
PDPTGADPAGAAGPDAEWAIATRGLTKRFGSSTVVDTVDLNVPTGSVFGFLGPNGAGKTTTIRLLLGLVGPSAGTWRLLGQPMPDRAGVALPQVGALIEGPAFYPWLSGSDNLARFDAAGADGQRHSRRDRIDAALAQVGLTSAGKKKYRAYSLGMRQRLGLAAAMLRPRRLIVLDEPTNGMDPQGTREIRHIIRELASAGTTVFLSSHLLSEVEQVCSHVAVMSRGRLLTQGTLADLRSAGVNRLRVEVDDPVRAASILARIGLAQPSIDGDTVGGPLGTTTAEQCCRELVLAGIAVRDLRTERPTLEELFMALTGEGFDVVG